MDKGDRIAILSENCLEWVYADMGALGIGAVVVPIYTTLVAKEVRYIMENSEAKVLFVENREQMDKTVEFIDAVESFEKIVCFDEVEGSDHIDDYKIGTVGKPIPHVDIQIAEDGVILVKGDNVFAGYWKMPDETRASFDAYGYFMSGDIGRFDEDGFLSVTDRKKNLIITSGGKNVAPQKIEGVFKYDPLFAHFLVVGDRRKFLSALVNINLEQAERIAQQQHIPYAYPTDLLENHRFLDIIDGHVANKNKQLARYESIKKYRIIKHEFSQESGELTPSLKMKKNVIYDKYSDIIEEMYRE